MPIIIIIMAKTPMMTNFRNTFHAADFKLMFDIFAHSGFIYPDFFVTVYKQ